QSVQHVANPNRVRHLRRSTYHQLAGGSLRIRAAGAMVPEILGAPCAATGSIWWPCPLYKDSRGQLSRAFRCPEFAGLGGDIREKQRNLFSARRLSRRFADTSQLWVRSCHGG